MATSTVPKPPSDFSDGSGMHVTIVAARWHQEIVDRMLDAAVTTLTSMNVKSTNIRIIRVPGSFELPLAVSVACKKTKTDAVIALGCVVRGETPHFDVVVHPVAQAMQTIQVKTGVPVIFGVLTTDTIEQAQARSGGDHGNKGIDCALAAIEMVHVKRLLHTS